MTDAPAVSRPSPRWHRRVLGMVRSLLMYRAIPGRQRRLRQLYAAFVRPNDLAFDVGAHAGNRTRALLALGCRVVAFEPQPDFAWLLRRTVGGARLDVVEEAVGATAGRASLAVSARTPTVTTLASAWRQARAKEPGFAGVRWDHHVEVDLTTLDIAVARFGVPAFVKVDVEGSEPDVLAGLSHRVAAVSFEYLPDALDEVRQCATRLEALGPYTFNWSVGETYVLVSPTWLDASRLLEGLKRSAHEGRSGDVYARLSQT